MEQSDFKFVIYFIAMFLIWAAYIYLTTRQERKDRETFKESLKAGLTEPVSLHPVININRCIGCGSCITACPENSVLGLIDKKSTLINPANCIGHGACHAACPTDAITLVFGSARRGVDIPSVNPDFQTNISGIYIAGELGGMGLIRNAVEQGRQAIDSIASHLKQASDRRNEFDVIIVGAGPAGFAASLAAKEKKLRFITLEQDSLGGTVFQFPRGKIVMTAPMTLPLYGTVKLTETTKEALLELWQKIEKQTGLKINYHERMESIECHDGIITVTSNRNIYRTKTLLLAIGRRGTPRKLGVPGEEQSKVVYRLIDAEQYQNKHILVVGGGDSALEAATSLARQPGTVVTLSYRSPVFSRAKEKNRQKVNEAVAAGRLKLLLNSNVKEIAKESVTIEQQGDLHYIKNDAVIICAGGVLPTPFLKKTGIDVETKYGTA